MGRLNDKLTRDALAIWNAGVDSVRGDRLVENSVSIHANTLSIEGIGEYNLAKIDRILVLGGGKAAAGMAQGFERIWNQSGLNRILLNGWVHAPRGSFDDSPLASKSRKIHIEATREAGCNEPSEAGVAGSMKMLDLARSANGKTLVLCFISGGASALMPLPVEGVSLQDKVAVARYFSQRGASIDVMNEVRRCLSQIKGGGLARAASKAQRVVSLILSDVLGDPLALIGSGPTLLTPAPNPQLALKILDEWDPDHQLPESIRQALAQSTRQANKTDKSAQCPVDSFVIANNATAVDAAGTCSVNLGYAYWMESSRQSEGDVRDIAQKLFRAIELARENGQPDCLISGGEPTVALTNNATRGKGGRNQQLALHLLAMLAAHADEDMRTCRGISIVCGGTDGEDGPTDAAGAIVDERTMARVRELKLNVESYLERFDAYHFFQQVDGLLITGATNTNVCDLRVILVTR